MALECELCRHANGGPARAHAGEVNRKIAEDRQGSPTFARASQNVAAAAALLEALPAAATPEEQRAREKMQRDLHLAVDQQVESSASRRRNPPARRSAHAASEAMEVPVQRAL